MAWEGGDVAQHWSLGELLDMARGVCVSRRVLGSWMRAGDAESSSSSNATSLPAQKLPLVFPINK